MHEVLNEYSDDLDKIDEMFKESNKEPNKEVIEIISPKDDNNTTNWYDKNTFNEILITIDSNNFNHENKIGKFKFNDINDLINNIKNNTISEADTKKKINELSEIKKQKQKVNNLLKVNKNY